MGPLPNDKEIPCNYFALVLDGYFVELGDLG